MQSSKINPVLVKFVDFFLKLKKMIQVYSLMESMWGHSIQTADRRRNHAFH